MNLIDRYVYAVTENLKEDIKEDVSRELRTNIEDMLPDEPTENNVREVLEKLGNPKKLASEYGDSKRYLIGPELYDNYIYVLKLVTGIVAAVVVCASLLEKIFSLSPDAGFLGTGIGIFAGVISAGIEGAIQGALWVTIVFVILERTGTTNVNYGKGTGLKNKWSVNDLPEIPVGGKGKISRGETVFSMIFTVIFTALIYTNAHLIGIYTTSEGGLTLSESLFNDERLKFYMPMFLIVALFQFGVYVWKFVAGRWNTPLAIVNSIFNVASCILMYVMVKDSTLINEGFINKLTSSIEVASSNITIAWEKGINIFIAIFILIALWDSISGFLKSKNWWR